MTEYRLIETNNTLSGFPYNVQEWHSDDGKTFVYSGFGKFCRTKAEAAAYIKEQGGRND